MKLLKKPVSILLCIIITASAFSFSAAAAADDWDSYWQNNAADIEKGIIMQPGSDETERNFSWYMPQSTEKCSVSISTSPDMNNAEIFEGRACNTFQKDKSAKVTVTGLKENTVYYYTCNTGDEKSGVYSFSVSGSEFSAIYTTDIHITGNADDLESVKNDAGVFNSVLTQAAAEKNVSLILSAGDQASSGLRSEYTGLVASPLTKTMSFATAIGNHDTKGVDYKFFNNVPNEHYGIINSYQGGDYWFTRGEVLFLMMDSNNASGADHHLFVEQAVKANPTARWRVAVMHHDLWGQTINHRESENNLLRKLWTPLFDEFDIDLVLAGHSHHYSVSNVLYNGKTVQSIASGGTVANAAGTVYMVSGSLTRPRDDTDFTYGKNVAFGIEDPSKIVYNIIDFSENSITVTSYDYASGESFAAFTLEKDSEAQNTGMSFIRRILSVFTDMLGTVVEFFSNIGAFADLKKDGYDVSVITDIINNKNHVDSVSKSILG